MADTNALQKALDVRYVKLQFEVTLIEDAVLPINKVSAIRGALGNALLEQNCIGDQNCESCGFESECIVRRTIYSKYEVQPAFAERNDSIGFVLECENYKEEFLSGSNLIFYLILFGKSIVYLKQFLLAFYSAGQHGIGSRRDRFIISHVYNEWHEIIVDGNDVYKTKYKVRTLWDYVLERFGEIKNCASEKSLENNSIRIKFKSQTCIKYNKEFIKSFSPQAILAAVSRRIYMLDCYEGNQSSQINWSKNKIPVLSEQEAWPVQVERYSSTARTKMVLHGIKGWMSLQETPDELLKMLLAAEITHIGKNTSFGFGRIVISLDESNMFESGANESL